MPYLPQYFKRIVFIFIILCLSSNLSAQYNFYKLSIGGGVGSTLTFADATKIEPAIAIYGNVDYYFTPYISLGAEAQHGTLKGKYSNPDIYKTFNNAYITGTLNAKFQLGQFFSRKQERHHFLKLIRGLYFSPGIGIIRSKTDIIATNINMEIKTDIIATNMETKTDIIGYDPIFPIGGGINFYFPDKWGYQHFAIDLNLQTIFSTGDGMDGNLNAGNSNNFNDIYTYFSAGIKYYIRPLGLYKKR